MRAGDAAVVSVTATIDGAPVPVAWTPGALFYILSSKVTAGGHTVAVTVTDAKGVKRSTTRLVTAQ